MELSSNGEVTRSNNDKGTSDSLHDDLSDCFLTDRTSDDQTKKEEEEFTVYPMRWYILGVFVVCGIWQNLVYGTFGPISKSAETALELTQTDLALLPNWFNVAFLISAFPYVWLVEVRGLRLAMITTMASCAIGASLRCLHTGDRDVDKIFLHLGQLINGFGGAVPWFGCTTLSALWFPPHQRNLATAIGLFTSGLGVSFAFLLGPAFVDAFGRTGVPEDTYAGIYYLFYMEAVVSTLLLFLTVMYFPSKPPTPPSVSASTKRVSYFKGFRQFAKNRNAWIMFAVYCLNTISTSWNHFIALTVQDVMKETEVGWLGFTMLAVSIAAGPVLAQILAIPRLASKSRMISITMVTLACGLIALFVVAANIESQKYLLTRELIWYTMVPMLTLLTAPEPVWWEMACDCVFPVPESIVSGIFSYGSCAVSVIFYLILMFPQLGFMWINWALLVSQLLIIPLLIIYRHDGRRTSVDRLGKIIEIPDIIT